MKNYKERHYEIRVAAPTVNYRKRFCDLIFDGKDYYLETKSPQGKVRILLRDFRYQLDMAEKNII